MAKARARQLSGKEKRIGREVFGNSVPLNKVRVFEGGKFRLVKGRAFVWFDWIVDQDRSVENSTRTLVHELVHVWQSRHPDIGVTYVFKSLCEQARNGNAYDVSADDIAKANRLLDLGIEQQATLVEGVYEQDYQGMKDRHKREKLAREVYTSRSNGGAGSSRGGREVVTLPSSSGH